MTEWKPGVFVVSQDTLNPYGNHRCKHDFWEVPIWKKGEKVLVEECGELFLLKSNAIGVKPYHSASYRIVDNIKNDVHRTSLETLLPVLEPAEESLDTVLMINHISARAILNKLLARGLVEFPTIKMLAEEK